VNIERMIRFLDPSGVCRKSSGEARRSCFTNRQWCVLLMIALLLDPTENILLAPSLSRNVRSPSPRSESVSDMRSMCRSYPVCHPPDVIGGDFRHWFHQIPAPSWMRRLFGLRGPDGTEHQWQSIPMGWSWSPLIAQACAWTVLAFLEADEAPLLDPKAFAGGR
jgi:hypothetical protein